MRILVAENDPVQAVAIKNALRPLSRHITIAGDGEEALRYLGSEKFDVIVIDWNLPKMNGIGLLHWFQGRTLGRCGVLFLSDRADEIGAVKALEAGADDYMAKPFRAEELAARVSAVLRRMVPTVGYKGPIVAGNYVLDPSEQTVTLRGNKINLTTKEYQLAASLFNNVGQILSRESLALVAWGADISDKSRSLDTHIYRIRQKLNLTPANGLRLSTVYTLGYRLDVVRKKADISRRV